MRRLLPVILAVAALVGFLSACYEDTVVYPHYTFGPTRVFLRGTPFPHTGVAAVEVYVVDISASTLADPAAGEESWSQIEVPRRRYDLLRISGDSLAPVGGDMFPNDVYYAVRLTIDGDSSVVSFNDGSVADVKWPADGQFPAFAHIEVPIAVPDSGSAIVIEFDLENSLVSDLSDPLNDFRFSPVLRAVDSSSTGAINGTIMSNPDGEGNPAPVENAWVSVFRVDSTRNSNEWLRTSAGRTDAAGYYKIGFLSSGLYSVHIDAPQSEVFGHLVARDVQVVAGEDFILSVTLPSGSVAGVPFWR